MSPSHLPDDELIGQTIAGRYRIISRLGAGGMGVAYRAWDEEDGVPVVIKIPKRIFLDDPKFAERFAREIRLLQGLKHPHIVPIVDVGEHEGLPYVAMRFLPGGSLSDRRLRGDDRKPRPNPPGMLHLWLPSIAEALDHVHANGVVHRDVKPGNIFFDAFWNAFLGDFGIAKIVEESESFDRENTLTATNMGIGTQEYMGPEQFTPKPVLDGRTDQYALAVMVYEMLAGARPFTGTTAHLIIEVTTQPVPPLDRQRSGLPASLVQAVHRGLAKNPGERFSTCREFAYEVLRDVPLLADEPDIARLLCPKCSNILKLPVAAAGQKGKCPKCQTTMKVADDLGALWLLDEARRQRRAVASVVDVEDIEEDQEPSETGAGIDEAALEAFKPVSSTTPIGRAARKPGKKASTGMIVGGVAAAVVALAALLMIFGGGGEKPVPPVTYEQKLAQAQENLRLNPNDTDANDFLARHWCFKKDDWKKGLPYLAKSGAMGLWNTAKKQLDLEAANPAAGPGDMVGLAKDWWTLAGQRGFVSADEGKAIKKHAAAIYMAAVDGLTDSKDIDDTNRWLDRNKDFLAIVGGRRPPKAPKPVVTVPNEGWPIGVVVNERTGNAYKVFPGNISWPEAKQRCESLGGHLVTIASAEEQAFVQSLAMCHVESMKQGQHFLIGLTDEAGAGSWAWVDGTGTTFSRWQSGEPNNIGDERYVELLGHVNGDWNNIPAGHPTVSGFICEWESGQKPIVTDPAAASSKVPWPADAIIWSDNSHAYKAFRVPGSISWTEAQKACNDQGGILACGESSAEFEFLYKIKQGMRVWLGGREVNKRWVWTTGAAAPVPAGKWGENKYLATTRQSGTGGRIAQPDSKGFVDGYICEWAAPSRIINSIGTELIIVRPGTFMMGTESGEGRERPPHKVRLTKSIYVGVYEITNKEWQSVMGSTPSDDKDPFCPVTHVSWSEANEFCEKLSSLQEEKAQRLKYRLPSEAEWEYFCRAGSQTRFYGGDDASTLGEYAWHKGNAGGQVRRVGQKRANAWGLFDVHGNVAEWCSDWMSDSYYAESPEENPTGPENASFKVARGGCWDCEQDRCTSTIRIYQSPSNKKPYLGMRVVAERY